MWALATSIETVAGSNKNKVSQYDDIIMNEAINDCDVINDNGDNNGGLFTRLCTK